MKDYIKKQLGITEKELKQYLNISYTLRINPLPDLRRRFVDITWVYRQSDDKDVKLTIGEQINTIIINRLKEV